jgi:hypothetical protein
MAQRNLSNAPQDSEGTEAGTTYGARLNRQICRAVQAVSYYPQCRPLCQPECILMRSYLDCIDENESRKDPRGSIINRQVVPRFRLNQFVDRKSGLNKLFEVKF